MCNSVDERPIDVADDDEVIELLRQHARGTHLSDDVKPTCPTALPCSDQHAAGTKRRHLSTTDEESNDDVDVELKPADYKHLGDAQMFSHYEPLDLSVRAGTDSQSAASQS